MTPFIDLTIFATSTRKLKARPVLCRWQCKGCDAILEGGSGRGGYCERCAEEVFAVWGKRALGYAG
jgi:hypothetical protein